MPCLLPSGCVLVMSESHFHFPHDQRSSRFPGTPTAPCFRMAPLHSLLVFLAFLHWAVYYDTIDGHLLKFSFRDFSEVRIFVVVETRSHVAQASFEFNVAKNDLDF